MELIQYSIPFFSDWYAGFGLAGCTLICLAVFVSASLYRGRRQERFSLLNHFISELGEKGISTGAHIFNGGLILASLILLPFIFGLGLHLTNIWGILATIAAVITALACIAVGMFPMNNLSSHVVSAMVYFRSGLAMAILYTIAILTQPDGHVWVPKWSIIFGILAILTYASFLALVRGGSALSEVDQRLNAQEDHPPRPRFWALPAVEWSIFFSTMIMFFAIALITV